MKTFFEGNFKVKFETSRRCLITVKQANMTFYLSLYLYLCFDWCIVAVLKCYSRDAWKKCFQHTNLCLLSSWHVFPQEDTGHYMWRIMMTTLIKSQSSQLITCKKADIILFSFKHVCAYVFWFMWMRLSMCTRVCAYPYGNHSFSHCTHSEEDKRQLYFLWGSNYFPAST